MGNDHLPHVEDLARQRDADRADGLAGVAGEAEALRSGDGVDAVEERCHDEPDRAGVDMPEDVPADLAIGRADVRARRAADAMQRLAELRHLAHRAATVVEQHQVLLVPRRRPLDERRVDRDALGGRAPRQQAELGHRVVVGGDQLLDPGQHDVHGRDGRRQPPVSLVGAHHHCAALGDERVRPGDPHTGAEEDIANGVLGDAYLLADVVAGDVMAQMRREHVTDLLA